MQEKILWGFRKGCDFIKENCNSNFDEFKKESGCDLHHVGVNFIFYFLRVLAHYIF